MKGEIGYSSSLIHDTQNPSFLKKDKFLTISRIECYYIDTGIIGIFPFYSIDSINNEILKSSYYNQFKEDFEKTIKPYCNQKNIQIKHETILFNKSEIIYKIRVIYDEHKQQILSLRIITSNQTYSFGNHTLFNKRENIVLFKTNNFITGFRTDYIKDVNKIPYLSYIRTHFATEDDFEKYFFTLQKGLNYNLSIFKKINNSLSIPLILLYDFIQFILKILDKILKCFIICSLVILPLFAYYYSSQNIYNGQIKINKYNSNLENNKNLENLFNNVTIYTDKNGLSHIQGDNEIEVYFGLGFEHAKNRLWQIDILRRSSEGRLSEFFGKKSIKLDTLVRGLGLYHKAKKDAQYVEKNSEFIDIIKAYIDGINFYAKNFMLPIEYKIFGVKFEEWKLEDSIAILNFNSFGLGHDWNMEVWYKTMEDLMGKEFADNVISFRDKNFPYWNETIVNDDELTELGLNKVRRKLDENKIIKDNTENIKKENEEKVKEIKNKENEFKKNNNNEEEKKFSENKNEYKKNEENENKNEVEKEKKIEIINEKNEENKEFTKTEQIKKNEKKEIIDESLKKEDSVKISKKEEKKEGTEQLKKNIKKEYENEEKKEDNKQLKKEEKKEDKKEKITKEDTEQLKKEENKEEKKEDKNEDKKENKKEEIINEDNEKLKKEDKNEETIKENNKIEKKEEKTEEKKNEKKEETIKEDNEKLKKKDKKEEITKEEKIEDKKGEITKEEKLEEKKEEKKEEIIKEDTGKLKKEEKKEDKKEENIKEDIEKLKKEEKKEEIIKEDTKKLKKEEKKEDKKKENIKEDTEKLKKEEKKEEIIKEDTEKLKKEEKKEDTEKLKKEEKKEDLKKEKEINIVNEINIENEEKKNIEFNKKKEDNKNKNRKRKKNKKQNNNIISPTTQNDGASNCWVLSGNYTKSGKPLLSNDPHLPTSMPSLFFLAKIYLPNNTLTGATLPGCPVFASGSNNYITWGLTTENSDNTDICQEKIDEKNYIYDDKKFPLKIINDIIYVKDSENVRIDIKYTRNGPLIPNNLIPKEFVNLNFDYEDSLNISFRSAFYQFPFDNFDFYLKFNLYTKKYEDILPYIDKAIAPNYNAHYASVDGEIGWVPLGKIAVKNYYNRLCKGYDPKDDIIKYIPRNEMLYLRNPLKGYIVTANNKPASFNYIYELRGYHNHVRAHRINQMIKEYIANNKTIDINETIKMVNDVKENLAEYILPKILKILERNNINNLNKNKYYNMFKKWNYTMNKESETATLYAVFERKLAYDLLSKKLDDLHSYGIMSYLHYWNFLTGMIDLIYNNQRYDLVQCSLITGDSNCEKYIIYEFNKLNSTIKPFLDKNGNIKKWGNINFNDYPHIPFDNVLILKNLFSKKVYTGGNRNTVKIVRGPFNHKKSEFIGTQSARVKFICDTNEINSPYVIIPGGNGGSILNRYYNNLMNDFESFNLIKFENIDLKNISNKNKLTLIKENL